MSELRITGGSGTIPTGTGRLQKVTFSYPLVTLVIASDAASITVSGRFLFRAARWRCTREQIERVDVAGNSLAFFARDMGPCRFKAFNPEYLTPAVGLLRGAGVPLRRVNSTAGIAWKL